MLPIDSHADIPNDVTISVRRLVALLEDLFHEADVQGQRARLDELQGAEQYGRREAYRNIRRHVIQWIFE